MRSFALVCLMLGSAAGQEPNPVPQFSLPTLKGQMLTSQELKDNIVVLDFWTTWCTVCISEIPDFNRLQQKYRPQGVRVIGVTVQSGWASDVRKFATKYKMRYTILVGNDDTVADFSVINFPTTYVIGPGWKVYKKYSGITENKASDIERDIETLLKVKH